MAQHHTLDARRLMCPMPVIRTQDTVKALAAGDTLEVRCTDPGARHDIPAWCRISGHRVTEVRDDDGGDIVITVLVGEG